MTPDALMSVARRRGMVRWVRSGIYERLFIGHGGVILAEGPATRTHVIVLSASYWCYEIDPRTPVTVGAMFFPRIRGRYYKPLT